MHALENNLVPKYVGQLIKLCVIGNIKKLVNLVHELENRFEHEFGNRQHFIC